MGVVNPVTLSAFIVTYTILAIVSAISISSNDALQAGDLIDNAFNPEIVTVDTAVLEADNPFEAVIEVPKTADNNFSLIVQALTFQAPIWDHSWTKPIIMIIGAIMAGYVIVLGFFGIGLVLRILGR